MWRLFYKWFPICLLDYNLVILQVFSSTEVTMIFSSFMCSDRPFFAIYDQLIFFFHISYFISSVITICQEESSVVRLDATIISIRFSRTTSTLTIRAVSAGQPSKSIRFSAHQWSSHSRNGSGGEMMTASWSLLYIVRCSDPFQCWSVSVEVSSLAIFVFEKGRIKICSSS